MQHGQESTYTPAWDASGRYAERVIIEEVISSDEIVIRFMGTDETHTVTERTLTDTSGTPCGCRS